MSPPTKEGLEVKVDLTVLYHIKPEAAPSIYTNVGLDYGRTIVINNFMAIVRETIEKNIEDKLREAISPYGIVLDDVLVKDRTGEFRSRVEGKGVEVCVGEAKE